MVLTEKHASSTSIHIFFFKFLKVRKKFEEINKEKGQTLCKQISFTKMMNGNGGAISEMGLKRSKPKSQSA